MLAVGSAAALAYSGMYPRAATQSQPAYGGMMGGLGYGGMMVGGMAYGGMMGYAPYSYNYNYSRGYGNVYCYNYSSGYAWSQGGALVRIAGDAFYPQTLTVHAGTTVTWVNMDFVQHTVTSGSEAAPTPYFDSHELGHMQAFSYTFSTPGTYDYYCDVHLGMVGTVVVTA